MLKKCIICTKNYETSCKSMDPYICPNCENKGFLVKKKYPVASRQFRHKKRKSSYRLILTLNNLTIGEIFKAIEIIKED